MAGDFNHAPQWGATWRPKALSKSVSTFQSTHPSGVRPAIQAQSQTITHTFQSTHPSGVRPTPRTPTGSHPAHFNPRTPVGCDTPAPTSPITLKDFNPRTPVGCDDSVVSVRQMAGDFNPRTPVGCDEGAAAPDTRTIRFQSTHPSGVRLDGTLVFDYLLRISIHAPQWGATSSSVGTMT